MAMVIIASSLDAAVRMYTPGSEAFYDIIGARDPASPAIHGWGITYDVDQATYDQWVAAHPDQAPFLKVVTQAAIDFYSDPMNTHGYELGLDPPTPPPLTPPVNLDVPAISQTGAAINCTMGNWEGEPSSYAYRWQLNYIDIATVTASHTVVAADVGKTACCFVTATNDVGSTEAGMSNAIVVANPQPLNNTVTPVIQQANSVINCNTGTWTGSPTGYAYQWKMGAANVGTNSPSYTIQAGDVGSTATCVVTASNAYGTRAASPSSGVVVTTPAAWTAAVLNGAVQADPAATLLSLQSVTDGSMAITINGTVTQSILSDFSGSSSLDVAAANIQGALGGSTVVRVAWVAGSNRFTITTVRTGRTATLSYATPPAAGTDISALFSQTNGSTITNGTGG